MNRAISSVRYASRQTGVNFEKWLTWGAIGVGAYFVYKLFAGISAAKAVLTSTGEAIGSGLYDFVNKAELARLASETQHIVNFPDGSRHAVPSSAVNGSGIFRNSNLSRNYIGDGRMYRLMTDKAGRGTWYAVPV